MLNDKQRSVGERQAVGGREGGHERKVENEEPGYTSSNAREDSEDKHNQCDSDIRRRVASGNT